MFTVWLERSDESEVVERLAQDMTSLIYEVKTFLLASPQCAHRCTVLPHYFYYPLDTVPREPFYVGTDTGVLSVAHSNRTSLQAISKTAYPSAYDLTISLRKMLDDALRADARFPVVAPPPSVPPIPGYLIAMWTKRSDGTPFATYRYSETESNAVHCLAQPFIVDGPNFYRCLQVFMDWNGVASVNGFRGESLWKFDAIQVFGEDKAKCAATRRRLQEAVAAYARSAVEKGLEDYRLSGG